MGEMVEFASNGGSAEGYLAPSASGDGPGVLVIQEWWGLNEQIRDVCDRFGAAGFVALAPDLYRGERTTAPDEAGRLMMALNVEQAAKDMAGGLDFLKGRGDVTGSGLGVTGFCMGGGLALWIATLRPDDVQAVVPFYGVLPWPNAQPDYSRMRASVMGHYGEHDDSASPAMVAELDETLQSHGVRTEFFVYADCDHAFANHHRPEVFMSDEAELAFSRTAEFFRSELT